MRSALEGNPRLRTGSLAPSSAGRRGAFAGRMSFSRMSGERRSSEDELEAAADGEAVVSVRSARERAGRRARKRPEGRCLTRLQYRGVMQLHPRRGALDLRLVRPVQDDDLASLARDAAAELGRWIFDVLGDALAPLGFALNDFVFASAEPTTTATTRSVMPTPLQFVACRPLPNSSPSDGSVAGLDKAFAGKPTSRSTL